MDGKARASSAAQQPHSQSGGATTQQQLANITLLVAGTPLGGVVAEQVAHEGIGRFILVDGARVGQAELLWPQFTPRDVGKNRATIVAERLALGSPDRSIRVVPHYLQEKGWFALAGC